MAQESDEPARATAEDVARRSYGKLVAFLAARTGDVAGAEDALADAFAAALVEWPVSGIPERPEAWLMAVARNKQIDAVRRRRGRERAAGHLRLLADELAESTESEAHIQDDRLRLMFACAHPAIDPGVRAALILQTVLGFDAAAIASAFLLSPQAMSQRLVRAKSKIRQAGIPFRLPEPEELRERLDSVLEAIYAVFSEGWSDPAGTELRHRNLAEEGIWLGRLVASLLPEEPEALGLLALMLHAEARRVARRDAAGEYVPLAEQDVTRWNVAMIAEAEALLFRAGTMGIVGRYQLEAAVQSAHAVRWTTGRSDWAAIERIYETLAAVIDSPVVTINRAIAVAETRGAAAGLGILDSLALDAQLGEYQSYWAARAALLTRLGHCEGADQAYELAIGLEPDPAVRRFLQRRQAEMRASVPIDQAGSEPL
jgi:RNA polymerase sigma-70 factor (ECF subfamily)